MDLIKSSEIIKYQFYTMPKELFSGKYKKMSLESKMIYTLLIDRLSLSQKNNWVNEVGEVFLIFKREDIADFLCLSKKTTIKAINELKNIGLLLEKRQGLGKPNLIYIGKLVIDNQENTIIENKNSLNGISGIEKNTLPELKKLQVNNCKNYSSESENNTPKELNFLQANNTNINNNNLINTEISQSVKSEELEEIKNNCELDLLEEMDQYGNIDFRKKNMVENAIELMYFSESIKVGSAIIPQSIVRKKLKQLNGAIIFYALEKFKNNVSNTQSFVNSTKYLISCLYNAITEYFSDAELQYVIDIQQAKTLENTGVDF